MNPFDKHIADSGDDPGVLLSIYEDHRRTRNAREHSLITDPNFPGWKLDSILANILKQSRSFDGTCSDYVDPRFCAGIVARPPRRICQFIRTIQNMLRDIAPSLYFTPEECLHLTVLELVNSLPTQEDLDQRLAPLTPEVARAVVNYTYSHRTLLIRPMITYDASGIALSYVPASNGQDDVRDSTLLSQLRACERSYDPRYTYHHLRRDLYDIVAKTKLSIMFRYIAPSAHLTIARFVNNDDFLITDSVFTKDTENSPDRKDHHDNIDRHRFKRFLDRIQMINVDLEKYYTLELKDDDMECLDWIVGEECGLDYQVGKTWYGKDERKAIGQGF